MYNGKGFVTNVHSSICLDIDLTGKHKIPRGVEAKEYEYDDVDLDMMEVGDERKSTSYSCRLLGVKRIKNNSKICKNDIVKLINCVDGFVKVNVKYVDKYGRLIVTVEVSGVDLTTYIISKYPQFFQLYSKKTN